MAKMKYWGLSPHEWGEYPMLDFDQRKAIDDMYLGKARNYLTNYNKKVWKSRAPAGSAIYEGFGNFQSPRQTADYMKFQDYFSNAPTDRSEAVAGRANLANVLAEGGKQETDFWSEYARREAENRKKERESYQTGYLGGLGR